MSGYTPTRFQFGPIELPAIASGEQIWLPLGPIIELLGLKAFPSQVANQVEADERSLIPGEDGTLRVHVTEPGLYRLIFSGRSPKAEELRDFLIQKLIGAVPHEVIAQKLVECAHAERGGEKL